MTTYTLFSQSLTDRGAVTTDASPYTLGVQFSVSQAVPLTGIWFYSGTGAAVLPSECLIFNADTQAQVSGTLNSSPSWSGAAGSGWVKCTYDGSVTLGSGVNYVAAVFSPLSSNWYSDVDSANYWTSGPGASGITNGPLSAPSSAGALNGQAVFHAGGTLTFPATTFSGYDFAVDVEVTVSVPAFSAVFGSTDGNGIQTWNVTSSYNGGATPVATRVLPPSSPAPGRPHAFLWCLTVEPGQGTTFGDPLATILALNAHNAYNVTCVEPGYAISPWYADNPGDASVSQETFIKAAVTWAQGQFGSGGEAHNLIGFSKSGLGGQGLVLRNPSVFGKCASWDAPFGMTAYDGTDPDYPGSPVGGGSAAVYGTNANFTAGYELSTANLTAWRNAADFASATRLWVGGFNTFQGDVEAYHPALASLGILHAYAEVSASAHAWAPSPGWVGPALAWMFPSGSGLLMASGII